MNAQGTPRLLVVDDEALNRELLEGILEALGYDSALAENGEQALALLDGNIDLVLLDVMMPGMDGFEVARRIREQEAYAQLPIVMVTALTGKEDRLRAVEAGANDFVTKPIDRTELRVRVASLLKMKAAQDEAKRRQDELRRKNEALEADLNLAREIQQAFFPPRFFSFNGCARDEEQRLRFDCRCFPTSTLGGDFADILSISDTEVGLLVCDVMGHGIRSALVTAILRGLAQELVPIASDPGRFLTELNSGLIAVLSRARTPMFASAFFAVADVAKCELRFANAGHPVPLLARRSEQQVEPLMRQRDSIGPVLGVFEEFDYSCHRCALKNDDLLVVFTDGLFEVCGIEGEFGEERLRETIKQRLHQPMTQLFDELLGEIQNFADGHVFDDDVCLVGMESARIIA